jgi:hypothetical protein
MPEFHIHADLQEQSLEFESFLLGAGAHEDPFLACEGVITHEPRYHYTFKFADADDFKAKWSHIVDYLDLAKPNWRGYIETEVLYGGRTSIADRPYDPSITLPFAIKPRTIEPGTFRRNELHIYFDDSRTDQRIKDAMMKIGFFPAWCQGNGFVEGIWTIQAATVDEITAIRPAITKYLNEAGGTVGCSIDEERVVHFRLSHSDVSLPPVIDRINWL